MAEFNRYSFTNTFSGGMNTDADKSIYPSNQYLYAENFRLFGDSGNTVGALENVTGNYPMSTVIPSGYYPVGYCNIRDELYLFVTQNTSPLQNGYSSIIKVTFSDDGRYVDTVTTVYSDENSSDGSLLRWSTDNDYKIKAVGRYESDDIKKIYFVDGYNTFRSINVATVSSTSPVNKFDVIPNFSLSSPQFSQFISGRLTAGKVQYAYQMYDLNGAETLFSPASPLISISEKSGQSGSNKTFKGSDVEENTGKGISIVITPPSGFNRIRVVSIKYDSINSIPIINIIADQDISTTPTSVYFSDFGTGYLGNYTYEEFALVGRSVFTASEIEEKNNYLFTANIIDRDWDIDFDARAYRFASISAAGELDGGAVEAAIFNGSSWGVSTWDKLANNCLINGTTSVPSTHNCINPYNDTSLDELNRTDNYPSGVYLYNLKFKSDGYTLGGSGVNVSYEFVQDNKFVISSTGTDYSEDYCYNTDYSNISVEVEYTGYQRDETYRFGIIFFDEKGRSSTVKWIGDVRFPYYNDVFSDGEGWEPADYSPFFMYPGGTPAEDQGMRPLGIKFTVSTASAYSQGARYFKIVRVKRESGDRSILAQGVIPSMLLYNDGSGQSYRGFTIPYTATATVGGITKSTTAIEFISPEVNFNKNLEFLSGDTIEVIGIGTSAGQWDNFADSSVSLGTLPTDSNYSHIIKYGGFNPFALTRSWTIRDVNDLILLGQPSKSVNVTYQDGVNIDGLSYKVLNFIETTMSGSGSSSHFAPSGTKVILSVETLVHLITSSSYYTYYCNYRRNVFNSQYGGNTYSSRQNNSYISCGTSSACLESGTVDKETYGGDTYIGMYDYLRNIITGDIPSNRRTQLAMYFPIETSINLRYRSDECFSKGVDDASHSRMLMQELAGLYTSGSISYNQTTDLYKYNSVYSQENITLKYFPKSDLVESGDKQYDNRVLVSDLKIDGEISDSWTMFRSDNFLDVNSKYGQITTLLHKDNYLYFWQPKAFGVLSVSQRSLIQDNNQGALVIGTGGILDRYDYLTTSYGCSTRFSVVLGLNGLYWMDNINKVICRYDGQSIQPLSKTKGINSYLKSKIDLDTESMSCFDRRYNEVLFTVPYSYTEEEEITNTIYTITATTIPVWTMGIWANNVQDFESTPNFRIVAEIPEVSGSNNYWSDVSIFFTDNTFLTQANKNYLRNGTNTFDINITDSGIKYMAFSLGNAGSGDGNPWINPYDYKLVLDSIKCYELTEGVRIDEEFTYSDGELETVTSGTWETTYVLISTDKINVETEKLVFDTDTAMTNLYAMWATYPNIITPTDGIEVKYDLIISAADSDWYNFNISKGVELRFTVAGDYNNPVYVRKIDGYPLGSVITATFNLPVEGYYDLVIYQFDFRSSSDRRYMVIDYVKIYGLEVAETPFFTEDFDAYHNNVGIGDIPDDWIAFYRSGWGLLGVGSGSHSGQEGNSAALVFNEIFDCFTGVYTFGTDIFISPSSTDYITSYNEDLYIHSDDGYRNTFFDIKYPSKVKLLVNDKYNYTKTFDSIQYGSSYTSVGVDQYYNTFNSIRVYNDYQNSDWQYIYTSGSTQNTTRKEREFITIVPRNRVSYSQTSNVDIFDPDNLDEIRSYKERMRDKYLITELEYDGTNISTFIVPYITTNYRISKR